ncbi:hypothetical protein BgiBS90_030842 [Biomphalaria glabrata]|nr:hypothetical protein BgiBS90_030842 [Biomphalaria glabrata]
MPQLSHSYHHSYSSPSQALYIFHTGTITATDAQVKHITSFTQVQSQLQTPKSSTLHLSHSYNHSYSHPSQALCIFHTVSLSTTLYLSNTATPSPLNHFTNLQHKTQLHPDDLKHTTHTCSTLPNPPNDHVTYLTYLLHVNKGKTNTCTFS